MDIGVMMSFPEGIWKNLQNLAKFRGERLGEGSRERVKEKYWCISWGSNVEFLQAEEVAYKMNENTALLEMYKLYSMTRLSLERNKFGEIHRWIVENYVCHVKSQ